MAIALRGRALGLPDAMSAIAGIDVVEGRTEMRSYLQLALACKRVEGFKYQIVESDDKKCVMKFTRPELIEPHTETFTIEDAKTAGLAGRKNYKTYPKAMLRNRCISNGINVVAPEIGFNVYDPDEIADFSTPRFTPGPFADEVTDKDTGEITPVEAAVIDHSARQLPEGERDTDADVEGVIKSVGTVKDEYAAAREREQAGASERPEAEEGTPEEARASLPDNKGTKGVTFSDRGVTDMVTWAETCNDLTELDLEAQKIAADPRYAHFRDAASGPQKDRVRDAFASAGKRLKP